jgi:alpha-beta hydrolase superfamily lysophospholipase
MTFERFQYTFVNSLPLPDQKSAYEKYVVPESRQVPIEALSAKIDFSKPHPPLLIISGGADHIIPAALNKANFNRYKRSTSKVDYIEFPGRVHFIIGQQGWENVSNYILAWLGDLKL